MGKQRQRNRITSKIDQLPEDIREEFEDMLLDSSITYIEISEHLKELGYDVSRSAVGRYAIRTNRTTNRLIEAQQQAEALVRVVKQNPDADYTEAGMRMLMDGLITRIATAEEEFDAMPIEKVGKLVTALSRTKVYKDKVRQDMKEKVELAFQGMEGEIMSVIKEDPELSEAMKEILKKAKDKMITEE